MKHLNGPKNLLIASVPQGDAELVSAAVAFLVKVRSAGVSTVVREAVVEQARALGFEPANLKDLLESPEST